MNKAIMMTVVIGTGIAGACIGAVAGYKYAIDKLESEYNERFDLEMTAALEEYDIRHKTGRYENLEDVARERLPKREPKLPVDVDLMDPRPFEAPDVTEDQLLRTVRHLREEQTAVAEGLGYSVPDSPTEEDWANRTIYVPPGDDEDTTTDREHPYVISVDTWRAKEKDYTMPQLFFYSVDNALTDSDGDRIDPAIYVGSLENLKFGHMSGDPKFVYIRNDELCCDFEIELFNERFED